MIDTMTLGPFESDSSGKQPVTELSVALNPLDCIVQWRRCGMTADYVANVCAYDFADRDVAQNVLSTVVNELLENAVKYSADKKAAVRLVVRHFGDTLRVDVANVADEAHVDGLHAMLEALARENVDALFVRQIENGEGDPKHSGIGLLMLRRDYHATIAARTTRRSTDGLVDVVIQVTLRADEVTAP